MRSMDAKIIPVLISIASLFPIDARARLLTSDQPPPGIHWQKIDTPNFKIIFPAEIESEAQRVANTLECLYLPLRKTLAPNCHKWPLILSNYRAEANGYVAFAPRKSEWFATPTQLSATGDAEWYNLLALHEGRHMVQFDRFNSGFTRLAGFLFGDYAILGLSLWHVPIWFWEGDAVGIETALSQSGRGRQPEFDLAIRTLRLNQKLYSYDKAYLGSYKDYCPNHYQLGYLMSTHARRQYGADIWNRVLGRSTRSSWNPLSFSRASRIETGRSTKDIYGDAMAELESLWQKQIDGLRLTRAKKLNQRPKKVWTQYRWPQYAADGSVIATIYGLADISTLIRIRPDGSETEITKIASYNRISVAGELIAWEELNPHPRWGAEVFSNIVVYDLRTDRSRRLTERGRYFSPAIAPNGQTIAVVQFTPERRCNLVLLDAQSGQPIRLLPNPDNALIKNPAWSPDGRRIAYVKQTDGHKIFAIFDLLGDTEESVPGECHPFDEYPVFCGDYLLFDSAWSGIDNIYAVNIADGRRFQVTSRQYGAYYPAVSADGTTLLFCDYDVNGLDLCEMSLDPQDWQPLESVERRDIHYGEPLVQQEQGDDLFATGKIPTESFPVADYPLRDHLLNIHSWYYFASPATVNLGLYSKDLLNTAALNAKLKFDANEEAFSLRSEVCYAGFYPILSAGIEPSQRICRIGDRGEDCPTEKWRETTLSLGADLPLDYSTGTFTRRLTLNLTGAYTQISDKTSAGAHENGDGWLLPFSYGITYQNYQTPARRDVKPTAGYTAQINFKHTPLNGDYQSTLFAVQGNCYLPGFARHHSFLLDAKIELQDPRNYRFASLVPFAKGYDYVYRDLFAGAGITYELPLAYPDFALGSLFYLKRLRSAFFGDFYIGKTGHFKRHYNSVGLDLNFDFNLFDLIAELNAGVRLVYRFPEGDMRLSVLIFGMEF